MRKTIETKASVAQFIQSLPEPEKRQDCRALVKLMTSATGQKPKMWGDRIIGFGKHHYKYANGTPAEICNVGFAPRARTFAFYMARFPGYDQLLANLGKHKFSGGCLHISKLQHIDMAVLETIVKHAYKQGGVSDD